MSSPKQIGFIGGGVMGGAMIGGLIQSKRFSPENIRVADPNPARRTFLKDAYNVHVSDDNMSVVRESHILILSIKPQMITEILTPPLATGCELIISILAGVPLDRIVQVTGNPRVVRAMPNTPATVQQAMTVWTATKEVSGELLEHSQSILGSFGEELSLPKEEMMDAVTALSGTGPAYIFLFMEALVDAGVHLGFSREISQKLVTQTMKGSVAHAIANQKHPAVLRNEVTSPGGTTAEALYHLEKGGLRTVVARGVWAAYQRSMGLGSGQKVSAYLGGRNPDALGDGK